MGSSPSSTSISFTWCAICANFWSSSSVPVIEVEVDEAIVWMRKDVRGSVIYQILRITQISESVEQMEILKSSPSLLRGARAHHIMPTANTDGNTSPEVVLDPAPSSYRAPKARQAHRPIFKFCAEDYGAGCA